MNTSCYGTTVGKSCEARVVAFPDFWVGPGDEASFGVESIYHRTARSLIAFLRQLSTTASIFYFSFHLGITPGSISIYYDMSICMLPSANFRIMMFWWACPTPPYSNSDIMCVVMRYCNMIGPHHTMQQDTACICSSPDPSLFCRSGSG